jgi:hypothetical protein
MLKNDLKSANFSKSFTLLETIFGIFVVIIAVSAIFALLSRIIILTSFSVSKFTASYLAQEGIEIVRNIRDSNLVARADWKENLPSGTFSLDYLTKTLPDFNCQGSFLKIVGDFYRCTSESQKFERTVFIFHNVDGNPDKMKVKVLVKWQDRGKTYSIEAEKELYNWFK